MNQQEFFQVVEEMKAPLARILGWIHIIHQEDYNQYNRVDWNDYNLIDKDLMQEMVNAAQELNSLMSNFQSDGLMNITGFFTHTIGGPIMTIRDNAKLVLFLKYNNENDRHPVTEAEYIRYIKKIKSAAEYLSSLSWDAILNIHNEHLKDE